MLNDLVPTEFHLGQNYPNPFRERTTIKYCVPHKCRVVLTIYNSEGEIVRRLVDEEKPAGTYEATWDAENQSSGTFTCRMKAGIFADEKKMNLIR